MNPSAHRKADSSLPPVLADRSVAPAPGWHQRPGCKWCCCSGRCSLLDFLSWVMLQLQMWKPTAPSLCCARCNTRSQAFLHSLLYWRQMLSATQSRNSSRAGRVAGCICDTKLSVIRTLLPDPLNSAAQLWASSFSAACVRDEFGDAQSRSQGTCAQRKRPTTDY